MRTQVALTGAAVSPLSTLDRCRLWCCDVGSRGAEDGSLLPRQTRRPRVSKSLGQVTVGAKWGMGHLTSSFRNWDNWISVGF